MALSDYVTLGRSGLRVSPFCLGAMTFGEFHGWAPLVALQIEYSLLEWTVEGELIPMAIEMGLGVTTWSPLKNGALSGKYTRENVNAVKPDRGELVTSTLGDRVPYKPIVGLIPPMDEGEPTRPATSVSLISGEHDAVLVGAALTAEDGGRVVDWIRAGWSRSAGSCRWTR